MGTKRPERPVQGVKGMEMMDRNTGQSAISTGRGTGLRKRWLAGGSALAGAAAALAFAPAPVLAQSVPSSAPTIQPTMQRAPARQISTLGSPMLEQVQREVPVLADTQALPTVSAIASRAYIDAKGVSIDAPVVPPPSGNTASSPPGTQTTGAFSITNAPLTGSVTTLTSTVAPAPGDTNTDGVNVLATANYLASEVNFTPGSLSTGSSDLVELLTGQAIINWTTFNPGGAGIDVTFLPSGAQLDFTSALDSYTVLNRIFTPGFDSAVRIDGTVTSNTLFGSGTGGNVWFYSPGGMIIGSTATFNVGSLVLTSSAIDSIGGAGSAINFAGVAETNTAVVIENGANISALDQGSYLAIVAPRIEQGGTVNVNGSVAYVAAEQAQLTINNGLFDITVGLGSGDANGIVHTGTTTGPASQGLVDNNGLVIDADARAIHMVAVPKNTAINMLVGGNVGYQAASAAAVTENGRIILTAGTGTTVTGDISNAAGTADTASAVPGGSISVANATFNSSVDIFASDSVDLRQSGTDNLIIGGDLRDDYDLSVVAGNSIDIGITDTASITVLGDLSLRAGVDPATGGTVNVTLAAAQPDPNDLGQELPPGYALPREMAIGGSFIVDASASGADDFATIRNNGGTGIGQDAAAGSINFDVSGGSSLIVGGNLVLDASAQGGKGEIRNGSGTAGDITVNAGAGTKTIISGGLIVDAGVIAAQSGKIAGNGLGLLGSDSVAGDISITLAGDQFSAGFMQLNASAQGSDGSDSSAAQSNDASAGSITLDITGGTTRLGSLQMNAAAEAGVGFDSAGTPVSGVAGRGGVNLALANDGTLLDVAGGIAIDASTSGVVAAPVGSTVRLSALDTGANGGIVSGGFLSIDTTAANGAAGAVTTAGSTIIEAANGNMDFSDIDINAAASPSGDGFSNDNGTGDDFQGGDVSLLATAGGRISALTAYVNSSGLGAQDVGGNGIGGTITVDANDAAINFGSTGLYAAGRGGVGLDPANSSLTGSATGGTINLGVSGAAGQLAFGDLFADVSAAILFNVEQGSGAFTGGGGSAVAGSLTVNVDGGVFTGNSVNINAGGMGGVGGQLPVPGTLGVIDPVLMEAPEIASLFGFDGGAIAAAPAVMTVGPLAASSGAPASGLPSAGDGGTGQGGTVIFNLNGGAASVLNLFVNADGNGGAGAFGDINAGTRAGSGGDGTGGAVTFNALAGTLDVTDTLSVSAQGNSSFGGSGGFGAGSEGGDGGNGFGGNATFNLNGTATVTAGIIEVTTDAFGGQGGSSGGTFDGTGNPLPGLAGGFGGDGFGGTSSFNNTSGSISFGQFTVSANGAGGNGGDSFGFGSGDSIGTGGTGGNSVGGTATINLGQDDNSGNFYTIQAAAIGGTGGIGMDSGHGGAAQGGTAQMVVNNVAANLLGLTLDATAAGGAGGFVDGNGGIGGTGGDAAAGTVLLDVNGAGGSFAAAQVLQLLADATGGAGAAGGFASGALAAGIGGAGGDAVGGQVQVISRNGASLDYSSAFSTNARGFGGAGGTGGGDFTGIAPADGGAGGASTGGSILLSATNGGVLDAGNVSAEHQLNANAIAAIGGDGGTGGSLPGGNPGANGLVTGGNVTLLANGAGSTIGFSGGLRADVSAIGNLDIRNGATGADATGGSALVSIANGGAITIAEAAFFDATATASFGDLGANAGGGGSAIAGNVDVSIASGSLSGTVVTIDVSADNSLAVGATGIGGAGGAGGLAQAGSVTIDNAGTMSATGIAVFANAIAAAGGIGDTGQTGGAGGTATAGTILVTSANDLAGLTSLEAVAGATGGAGGTGGSNAGGGTGGAAIGGTVAIDLTGTGAVLAGLSNLVLDADAVGGSGGTGGTGDGVTPAGSGGLGGDALGGSALLALNGAGATIIVDSGLANISASGFGGSGGFGGGNFLGGTSGVGGDGGNGTGGAVTLEAGSGTIISLDGGGEPFSFYSIGVGGFGGAGGNVDMVNGGIAGAGGNGGAGIGGSPTLRAIGGTINGTDILVSADGIGGDGGIGGNDGAIILGASGNGGDGSGGSALLELLDGSPGIIAFANAEVDANGIGGFGTVPGNTAAGRVDIRDLSVETGGLFNFASLSVDALGLAALPGSGVFFVAGSGANSVAGDFTVITSGDIDYAFDGTGQWLVGGNTLLSAGGNISVTHTNNGGGTISIDTAGSFDAFAAGNFSAAAQSILASGTTLSVRADGSLFANDLRATGVIDASAGFDATIVNAAVTGPPVTVNVGAGTLVVNGIFISAGGDNNPTLETFDPAYNAAITGTVTSTGQISVTAGGNAIFAAGSSTRADNGLTVTTGDDIIIGAGALVEAAAAPATAPDVADPFGGFNNLVLDAGGLARSGVLSTPALTPIASIANQGDIVGNGFAAILYANAIDGSGGTITASSISAEIADAPAAGLAQGNDNGLLGASCLEGNVCLGTIFADNRIEVGQNSNNDVIQLVVEQASISANDILVTTRNDIVMGTAGFPTAIDAANVFAVTSLTGDVDLRDAVVTSGQIAISAAGSLLGNGSLTSANDIGITVGQDIAALLIDTGGQLTDVANVGGAAEAQYNVPGAIAVGTLRQGAIDVNIAAGAGNSFGTIEVAGGANIALSAGNAGAGDVFLGAATTATDIDLAGDNAAFTTLDAAGNVTVTTPGTITGTDITSAGDIAFVAGGTVNVANVTAAQAGSGIVTIAGDGGIALGTLTANSADLAAVTGTVTVGDVDVTGLVTASGTGVQLASAGALNATATATAGTVDILSAGDLSVSGAVASGDITLASTGGSASVTGAVTSGGAIDISAAVDAVFSGAATAGTSLDVTAAGLVDVQAAITGALVNILSADLAIGAGGSIGRSDLTSGVNLTTAGDIALGGAGGSGTGYEIDNGEFSRIFSAGDVTISALSGASGPANIVIGDLAIAAGDGSAPNIGNIGSAGGLFINASGDIDVAGAMALANAGAGNVIGLSAGSSIRLDIVSGSIEARNAGGGLGGAIELAATRIEALSASALADITGASISAISTRLGQNDGAANDAGYLAASAITLTADQALLIQNSGQSAALAERRGITAGSLTINTGGPGTIIVINGVIGGETGNGAIPVTGISGTFDFGSTINGCLIINPAACFGGTGIGNPGIDNPIQDLIDKEIDPTDDNNPDVGLKFGGMLIEMRESDRMREDPLLDDPVTGAGNEDLWTSDEDCDDRDNAGPLCAPPDAGE